MARLKVDRHMETFLSLLKAIGLNYTRSSGILRDKRACVDGSARDRELKRVGKSFAIAPMPQSYILYTY